MAVSPAPASDAAEGLAIGSVLDGRYRIDGVLGAGGMGRVYRGEHTGIGRAVAIKILHADLTRNREAATRFQREALASGRLDHPNIVGVSDFGMLDDGACYLVMEALEGESLGDRLEREPVLPWREAIDIMRGVMQGLQHAHDRGVVHRDIKPDNIFLARKDGEVVVKILDFGIAKLYAGSAEDPASTRAGLTVGTPAYLSPEQAVGGEIKPASDIYSATIVLFEMLAGRTPFIGKEPLAMLGAHVSQPPPRVRDVTPASELPLGLDDVIQRGLVKIAAERIPSAADYLIWLESILAAMPDRTETPVPGSLTPMAFVPHVGVANSMMMTPLPGTPAAGSAIVPPTGTSPTEPAIAALDQPPDRALDRPPDRPPARVDTGMAIPRRWLTIGAIAIAVLIAIAIVSALASGPDESRSVAPKAVPAAAPPVAQPDKPRGSAAPATKPVELTVGDREAQLKAALRDLVHARTCPGRKAAIPRLVALRDPRAIPALKSARYRMRGGLLGIGDDNTNACLTRDAEAAIKTLTPPKKSR
ncbi:MAG: serine/threonine-protein kinase [Kofleriaceae bacterium]